MSRLIKEKIVEQYAQTFRGVSDVAVVKAEGVGVKDMTTFRRTLRARGIRAMRVQNRLGKRAFAAAGLAGIDSLLVGPSTLIWGGGIVEIAKVLAEEGKTLKELEVRGGVSAGQVLSKDDVDALAKLPSREELIGMVVGRAMGQGGRIVAALRAPGGRIVSQVREIVKAAPGGEEALAADAPPADAAAEAPESTNNAGGAEEPPAPEKAAGE